MRTLTVAVVLMLTACRGAPPGLMTGEATPEAAVTAFIGAAKAQDLQAMSAVWGDSRGSVRETMPRGQMEQREVLVIRLLCQDEHRIAGTSPGVDGRQFVRVELMRGGATLPRRFTTVMGPGSRWYVEDFEIDDALQRFCR
jgi:hypothetical protein